MERNESEKGFSSSRTSLPEYLIAAFEFPSSTRDTCAYFDEGSVDSKVCQAFREGLADESRCKQ